MTDINNNRDCYLENTYGSLLVLANPEPKKLPKEIEIKILSLPDPMLSKSEKAISLLKTAVKVILAPLTLLIYLIMKFFSSFSSFFGLGTSDTKLICHAKREQLITMDGEEIKFGLKGEAVLEGMYFEADPHFPNAKTILLCTGSHQSYEYYAIPMVKTLKSMGHHVMVFNYEGFGNSEGTSSEHGVFRSVEAAYHYLKQEKGCSDDSIVAWGYSLGSGAVTDLGSKYAVDVVIDRGFSSMSEVAYEQAPKYLKTAAKIIFHIGARFDNLSKLAKIQGNVFIAQGKNDHMLSAASHGKKLNQAIAENKNAIFREVDSEHFHGDVVWFANGSDHQAIKEFLLL